MTPWMESIVPGAIMTIVGIAVTVLVGRTTDKNLTRFVEKVAHPMADTVAAIERSVSRVPDEVNALKSVLRDLAQLLRPLGK